MLCCIWDTYYRLGNIQIALGMRICTCSLLFYLFFSHSLSLEQQSPSLGAMAFYVSEWWKRPRAKAMRCRFLPLPLHYATLHRTHSSAWNLQWGNIGGIMRWAAVSLRSRRAQFQSGTGRNNTSCSTTMVLPLFFIHHSNLSPLVMDINSIDYGLKEPMTTSSTLK